MVGHGALMILAGLIGGLFLNAFLVGGYEAAGKIVPSELRGTEHTWQNTHTGPLLNGLMVICLGLGLPFVGLKDKFARIVATLVVLDGWANVGFYFFAVFAENRALAFIDSRMGHVDVFSWLARGPAVLFGTLLMIALVVIGFKALSGRPLDS
jgi:styrene-oxide isomerase